MTIKRIAALLIATVLISSCSATRESDLTAMSFSDEPLTGKIIWHDLITHDMASAQRFYGELFGWTFESRGSRGGREYVVAHADDVYVAGILQVDRPEQGNHHSRWLPYMSVDDVDAALDRAVAGTSGLFERTRGLPGSDVMTVPHWKPEGRAIVTPSFSSEAARL